MIKISIGTLATSLALVACQQGQAESQLCGAAEYQHLVGNPLPPSVDAPDSTRFYGTEEMVTEDYVPWRLNVQVSTPSIVDSFDNPNAIVTRVFCG